MPVNPGIEYQIAEQEYHQAKTTSEKLKALQRMFSTVPKHKSSEKLVQWIKDNIKKYKNLTEKEKKTKKGSSYLSIKKEGAARISIIGLTNSGKSILLSKLTNAKPLISDMEFTTKLPEIGILDYKGIKLQIIELPAIVKNYNETKHGLFFLSLMRDSNMIIVTLRNKSELELIKKELKENDIDKNLLLYQGEDINEFRNDIWKRLSLIKVYTKQPGKEKDYPPVALNKGSKIRDIAEIIHKDFIKKFRFARVWGSSTKHQGTRAGLDHLLNDEDVIELHLE